MLVVRGKHKGMSVTLHRFGNDWVITEEFPTIPFTPTMLKVETEAERCRFAERNPTLVGTFWQEWVLRDDGTFGSLKPRGARTAFKRAARRHRRQRNRSR